jgi:hypothetical protein
MSKASQLIETQAFAERLRWLHVSPDELRYGTLAPTFKAQDSGTDMSVLTMQDREMLARYMTLSLEDRKTACDVVVALALAASVKVRQ